MREIKFRGYNEEHAKWFYGWFDMRFNGLNELSCRISTNMHNHILEHHVVPESLGQYTGLNDKNGKEIYEGDIIKIRYVQQNWQTHTGDNIPCGSYTEPDVTTINECVFSVVFNNGYFAIDDSEQEAPYNYEFGDILSIYTESHWYDQAFYDMDDNYFEDDGFETIEELKSTLGMEIIGNIFENPELLNL